MRGFQGSGRALIIQVSVIGERDCDKAEEYSREGKSRRDERKIRVRSVSRRGKLEGGKRWM